MKNLLLLLLLSFVLFSCEKESIQKEVNIELQGAFIFKLVLQPDGTFKTEHTDTLNYSLQIIINEEVEEYEIDIVLNSGFMGIIFEKTLKINEQDNVVLKIKNNNYPTSSYIYLRHDLKKLEFGKIGEFQINGECH